MLNKYSSQITGRLEIQEVRKNKAVEVAPAPPNDQQVAYILAILDSIYGVQNEQSALTLSILMKMSKIQEALRKETLNKVSDSDAHISSVISEVAQLRDNLISLQEQVERDRMASDQHDDLLQEREESDFQALKQVIIDLGQQVSEMAQTQKNIIAQSHEDKKVSDSRDWMFLIGSTILSVIPSVIGSYAYTILTQNNSTSENNKPEKASKDKVEAIRERITVLRQVIFDLDIKNVNSMDLSKLDMGLDEAMARHIEEKKLLFSFKSNLESGEFERFNNLYDTEIRGLLIQTRLEITLNKMEALVSPESFTKKNVETLNKKLAQEFFSKSSELLIENDILDYRILSNFDLYLLRMVNDVLQYPAFFQPSSYFNPSQGASSAGYFLEKKSFQQMEELYLFLMLRVLLNFYKIFRYLMKK